MTFPKPQTIIIMVLMIILSFQCLFADSVKRHNIDPQDLENIILVKDVKPGMKGYGKTVFRGTKIERFDVEVLGVLEKFYFGSDLILVKLTGGPMTERQANLIEGMSGSPIYLNGKIAGAFAFGYPFGKEPMGMVTPIEYMLDAWNPSLPSTPSSFYPLIAGNSMEPIPVSGFDFGKVTIDLGLGENSFGRFDDDTFVFQPLATPLLVSGMSPRVMSFLEESLKPLNIRPIAGPGLATSKANLEVDIEPGSAVGVAIVTGDIDMTGVGTVTYRRGDRILAFGHPMFNNPMMNGIGAIKAPLTTAYVYDIFPSMMVSSKIAGPIKQIGTVFQDRPWAIGAEIGEVPEMIPVTVNIDDQIIGRKRTFNVNVINHPLLSSSFIVAATAEALFQMRGSPIDATAHITFEVIADEVGSIVRENTYFDPVSIDVASVTELNQIISMLRLNQFYPVGIQKVNVTAKIMPEHRTARIERVFVNQTKFEPNDTIEIGAVIRPFMGEPVTKNLKLKLPNNIPNGRMNLEIYGGSMARRMSAEMGASSGAPTLSTVDNLRQLIDKFLEREKNDDLVARIVIPRAAPSISGQRLSNLPPTIAGAMRSSRTTTIGSEREEIKEIVPTDWVVFGMQRLPITIEKDDMLEKKSPARREAPSSPPPSAEPTPSADEESDDDDESFRLSTGMFSAGQLTAFSTVQADVQENSNSQDDASEKPTPAPSQQKESATEEKPVARTASQWKHESREQFLMGKLNNLIATTDNFMQMAGEVTLLNESSEMFVWSLAVDNDGIVFAGTGTNGKIYKIDKNGESEVFFDSPELQIHSLAMDSAGYLYAGTSPNGKIYKIDKNGKAETLFEAEESYILALDFDSKGNLYAAVGDKCKVYKISAEGVVTAILDTSELHALSLTIDAEDNVYVGTGQNGIIYKITPEGRVTVAYKAAEASITALTTDSNGILYAGTSPKGVLYRIAPDATPKAIYDKADRGILGLEIDDKGNIYALTESNVFKIMPDETLGTLPNEYDRQFISFARKNSRLYIACANMGAVFYADINSPSEAKYESPIHDAELNAKWGVINWNAKTPEGTSVEIRTRTGNNPRPDETWSGWSAPYYEPGLRISNPDGRYIQYQAVLKTDNPSVSPKLDEVVAVYLRANQPPKVNLTSPKGGEIWSGRKTIRWTGSDPDKDTLSYEVLYSNDGGENWTPLGGRISTAPPPTETPKSEEEAPAEGSDEAEPEVDFDDPEQILAEMAAELDKHPDIPQELKEQILAEAPAMIEMAAAERAARTETGRTATAPRPNESSTRQTSIPWDTAKVDDGVYLIKVVASDKLSNPTGALTDEGISGSVIVTNAPPRLAAFAKTITVQTDNSITLEGFASHELVPIAGVQFKVGSGEWTAAAANDGIFDSNFEAFTIRTEPLKKGIHNIEVKAFDQAGNTATVSVKASIQ